MRFVIFSPMASTSAIGRVTTLIVRAMQAQTHSVVLVRTEHESRLDAPAHRCEAEMIAWTQPLAVNAAIHEADGLIYQIGNNFTFHCGGLHWLASHPGIVCLHDFMVTHLFTEWAYGNREEAKDILESWYGKDAVDAFFDAQTPERFMEMATQLCPMTEWICSMASAVVSHSHWGMGRVAQSCAGPLRVLPLPYDAPSRLDATGAESPRPPKGELIRVLTVGHVNANKRVDSVIRAIGASSVLRTSVSYQLCGLIDPAVAESLDALAWSLGVRLIISGETEDAALQQAMNDAHVVCCLRWPSFEAASATTIEGLLYGKAVIVTDAAFYSELPDDCVRKISPRNEIEELTQVLEALCLDPVARRSMARRGQAWAERTFRADDYARQLAELSAEVGAARPVLSMVEALVSTLYGWGASSTLATSDHIAAALHVFEDTSRRKA